MLYNIFLFKDFFWYEPFLKSSLNFLQYCCCFVFWFFGCKVYGMWELVHKEGWAVLKNWCFQSMVLEKTLIVAWTARRSNQSILKDINPEYSLKGLMLKLKLQYFGHLMRRDNSLEKILMLGKTEGRREEGNREYDGWMVSLIQWTWTWANSRRWWVTGRPGMLQSMGSRRVGHDWVT